MRAFLCGVLLALALLFFADSSISAEEPKAEEKSCILDASLKYDIDELVSRLVLRMEAHGEFSLTEEGKRNIWEELYKITRESFERYYSIVKTPAECTTYFPSRELEDILHKKPPHVCIHIWTIEREVEKAIKEAEKDAEFSLQEPEREELKRRIVERYRLSFLEKGIFLTESECPGKTE